MKKSLQNKLHFNSEKPFATVHKFNDGLILTYRESATKIYRDKNYLLLRTT